MSKVSEVVYALAVPLKIKEADTIAGAVKTPGSTESKLGAVSAGLLSDLARGGVMVPAEWAERIQAAIGTTDPTAVVAAVEKSAQRQGDATVVEWVVDPTQVQFYQSLADNAGVTLGQQLKSIMDYAYMQGWLGQAAVDPFKLLFSHEQYQYLQAMFQKDIVTGDDVMERLRQSGNLPEERGEDDDVLLDSLRG